MKKVHTIETWKLFALIAISFLAGIIVGSCLITSGNPNQPTSSTIAKPVTPPATQPTPQPATPPTTPIGPKDPASNPKPSASSTKSSSDTTATTNPTDPEETASAENQGLTTTLRYEQAGALGWITIPLGIDGETTIREDDAERCLKTLKSVFTEELLLDGHYLPYYLAPSCHWGEEDEIRRYYLSGDAAEYFELHTDPKTGVEFIVDDFDGRHYDVVDDILHPGAKYVIRPYTYTVSEGETLVDVMESTHWCSDWRGEEAAAHYTEITGVTDADLAPGKVLYSIGSFKKTYILTEDRSLVHAS